MGICQNFEFLFLLRVLLAHFRPGQYNKKVFYYEMSRKTLCPQGRIQRAAVD